MKAKTIIKTAIDIIMTAALMLLMGYQFWGESAHEWIGAGMFALFIAHNILNISWYKTLFKGKYSPARIFRLAVNILVLADMLGLMISGIIMSRYVFAFVNIGGGMSFARSLHVIASHWGFVLMALHLGLHWSMVVGAMRRLLKAKDPLRLRTAILTAVSAIIAGYGAYVFFKRDFITYMLLKSPFVFLDYEEPKILFYLDHIALMGTFVFISHYILKLLNTINKKNPTKEDS